MAVLEVHNIEKHFGPTRVLEDISFDWRRGRRWPSSAPPAPANHAAAVPELSGNAESGDDFRQRLCDLRCRRPVHPERARGAQEAAALRNGISVIQPVSPIYGSEKCDAGQGTAGPGTEGLSSRTGKRFWRKFRRKVNGSWRRWPRRACRPLSQPAVRWTAAAVAIAWPRALQPDILCFDEPTSALDPELTGEVLRVIRGPAERKTTMIIVTHEMMFARDVADEVVFMGRRPDCGAGAVPAGD